ncbi:unnamed protein product, partial [Brassica oleracea var. botrytis]
MDILSLNNDDEYASEDAGSEQEMDENNPIVDESLMSTAEGKGCKKIDQLVFRDMIAVAIVEHDLPYAFVEFRRVREALKYANPTIEFWCRNTAVADVLKIFEGEKRRLKQV